MTVKSEEPERKGALAGGEVRETSPTGGSKGSKLAAFNLIPADALWELAEHYGKGSAKYDVQRGDLDNWRKGFHWSLCYASAYRHLTLAMGGEDVDPETQSKHVIAVAWHMLTLAHWLNDPEAHKYDDRQDVMEKERDNE